ncbi:anaerobic sulfatase maturase [Lacrimispora sp. BS-2]|uniref:Anaerobic sulfatase maturase n=1 Tax=Lacrimispora sp. BS-2 TaxID=3151850 RepID=A0AAU7PVZ5_9FIRM
MPPIQLLIKPASGSCNLRCKYCFYHDEMQKRERQNYGFMSLETLEEIVKKTLAYTERQCEFIFQGGEPTLVGLDFYKKLLEFESKHNIRNVKIMNSIQTNGYQLGEEWAEFFAANNFLVGVSLDGIKYTHDAYRENSAGEGSFGEIMKTLKLFDKKGVDYNILTVVNRRTAERIPRIYEFYKKNNWKYQQYIACLDPFGEPKGSREYSLTPEVYGEFLVKLFDLWYLDLMKGEQPYIRQFENYISLLMGYPPEACDMKGCCSIQHVVEADGSVYPCDFYVMDEYKIGNFLDNSIEDMGNRGLESGFVEASLNKPEECKTCNYAYLCRGGCRRNRQIDEGGQLGQNYFCSSYKYFFEKTRSRMEEIARQLMQSELRKR